MEDIMKKEAIYNTHLRDEELLALLPSTPEAIPHVKNGIAWYSFPALDAFPELLAVFSTRIGGISTLPGRESLDLGFNRGEPAEVIRENYRLLGEAAGFCPEDIVLSQQEHHTHIRQVLPEDRGNGILRPLPYEDIDGLWCRDKGPVLCCHFADCTSVFIYDRSKHIIALSHAGRRGVAEEMALVTVCKLQEQGCAPEDMVAVIGPSAGPLLYEVDEACAAPFMFFRDEQGPVLQPHGEGHYLLDLWRAERFSLLKAGLLPEDIHISGLCTMTYPDIFYSHRHLGSERGSLAGFMQLR